MLTRRATAALLVAIFTAGLVAAPAQAENRAQARPAAARDVPQLPEGAELPEGQWLNCHPHSFRDWCPILGPEWHALFWQYCDSIFGKQEYCVKTPAPAAAPTDSALPAES
ncbi:hypothetical protein ACIQF6_03100 [Kitasatospora sp. NPDC092948]|uniref:hypothetical protein n=1 Tax=Kitasatospora sp. NPDC092948 TaxID=3364088 RepID=UPI0038092FE6